MNLKMRILVICFVGILFSTLSIHGQNDSNPARASAHSLVYVTNTGSFGDGNTVSVIDTATNTVVHTVSVGQGAGGVAITLDGAFAYVVSGSSTVSVIDTATNTVVDTIVVGSNPGDVAMTPDGNFAYVTDGNSNSVVVIDIATNAVVTTIGSVPTPAGIAITPNGESAYVTNLFSNGNPINGNAGSVSVIDIDTNQVVSTIITVPQDNPFGLAIGKYGRFAYVTNLSSNLVSVISTKSNTVVANVAVGSRPVGVAVTPNGAFAYVSDSALFGGLSGISVINTRTNTVVATVPVGLDPQGLAFVPGGAFAYVANQLSNTVSVIKTATNTVVATVPVGIGPVGVAITPRVRR